MYACVCVHVCIYISLKLRQLLIFEKYTLRTKNHFAKWKKEKVQVTKLEDKSSGSQKENHVTIIENETKKKSLLTVELKLLPSAVSWLTEQNRCSRIWNLAPLNQKKI